MFTHYYRHMRYATYTYTALDNTSVLHTRDPTRVAKNASFRFKKRLHSATRIHTHAVTQRYPSHVRREC